MSESEPKLMLVVPKDLCQGIREVLEESSYLDKTGKITSFSHAANRLGIPTVLLPSDGNFNELKRFLGRKLELVEPALDISWISTASAETRAKTRAREKTCHVRHLPQQCKQVLQSKGFWKDSIELELPIHWEKHENLVIFPDSTFASPEWDFVKDELWGLICDSIKVERIARKSRICDDDFRSPRVQMLHAADGNLKNTWAKRVENGVIYTWDVTKCMFSIGNITEKMRIADFNCTNETVVDLFAGIGYFTIPYLVHANAKFLYACEWNPDSIEALERNLKLNKISNERYKILSGDNRETCPIGVADRVNLGLIPSSEISWSTACRALKPETGGILHIHGNVNMKESSSHFDQQMEEDFTKARSFCCKRSEWLGWALDTASKINKILKETSSEPHWSLELLSMTKVKSYGPQIDHCVLDLRCTPRSTMST